MDIPNNADDIRNSIPDESVAGPNSTWVLPDQTEIAVYSTQSANPQSRNAEVLAWKTAFANLRGLEPTSINTISEREEGVFIECPNGLDTGLLLFDQNGTSKRQFDILLRNPASKKAITLIIGSRTFQDLLDNF